MTYPVAEIFTSINGESIRAGEPAVFVRFKGCNLNCSYCDTQWANTPDCEYEELSLEEILKRIKDTGITNVTLTGGEPLLQKSINSLTDSLILAGHRVEIETNGSIPIKDLALRDRRPFFTLDYKLPSSGMEKYMLTDNYQYLKEGDAVKFVSGSVHDLTKAKEIIETFALTSKCKVYISPVFGDIDPKDIVDFMIKNKLNDVRLQLQLHKYIWDPRMRGV
ncbi:MAG: putative 7-carboxy-7-deazaguanine synthase QueE [Lachnospiraceae bacterium]|nr:putative 7-carboxy-7-deazaguanine synthase QueE [Lachnospiraceae bacterium]